MNYGLLNDIDELIDSYVVMSELTEDQYRRLGKIAHYTSVDKYIFRVFAIDKNNYYADIELFRIDVESNTIELIFREEHMHGQPVKEHKALRKFNYTTENYGVIGWRRNVFYLKDFEELKKLLEAIEEYGYILRRK